VPSGGKIGPHPRQPRRRAWRPPSQRRRRARHGDRPGGESLGGFGHPRRADRVRSRSVPVECETSFDQAAESGAAGVIPARIVSARSDMRPRRRPRGRGLAGARTSVDQHPGWAGRTAFSHRGRDVRRLRREGRAPPGVRQKAERRPTGWAVGGRAGRMRPAGVRGPWRAEARWRSAAVGPGRAAGCRASVGQRADGYGWRSEGSSASSSQSSTSPAAAGPGSSITATRARSSHVSSTGASSWPTRASPSARVASCARSATAGDAPAMPPGRAEAVPAPGAYHGKR
jgi:hypothetical protein